LRESLLLSSPGGTEMFQFPPFAAHAYGFSVRQFGYPGLNARLTAPPGFSQSSTPFIASWRQDIPHTPLVAWPHWSPPRRAVPAPKGQTGRQATPQFAAGGVTILSRSKGSAESHNLLSTPTARAAEACALVRQLLPL